MKVVCFLGGIPPGNKNPDKPKMLRSFADGVNAVGDTGIAHEGTQILLDGDVGVLQGFVHEEGKNAPHLAFRKLVLDRFTIKPKRCVIIDSNMFSFATGKTYNNGELLRFSFDGIFPSTGDYCNHDINTPEHWDRLRSNYDNLELHPYTNKGKHILICLQRNGGWSMRGEPVLEWLDQTIKTLRQHTDREIRIRFHPGDKRFLANMNNVRQRYNVVVSPVDKPLLEDLNKCWATVVKNSSPSVASLLNGVPVFATDPEHCQAGGLVNTDLSKIENPNRPDREEWLWKLSASHWNMEDLRNGSCWKHMRKYV